jgi:hypothetical protein
MEVWGWGRNAAGGEAPTGWLAPVLAVAAVLLFTLASGAALAHAATAGPAGGPAAGPPAPGGPTTSAARSSPRPDVTASAPGMEPGEASSAILAPTRMVARGKDAGAGTRAATPAPTSPDPAFSQVFQIFPASSCPAAFVYLIVHSAPGFRYVCPGYALGHQAMTCDDVDNVCPGFKEIVIADPCPAAYMNEAWNSLVLEGLAEGPFDPYGYCPAWHY